MVDNSHQHAENAAAILKVAYCRDGVDVAVQAAIQMIAIAAALLTSENPARINRAVSCRLSVRRREKHPERRH